MPFVTVTRASAVPVDECRTFELGGTPVAVFNAGGELHACRNVCPHRGGPVGEGDFDGTLVTCPWHGWQFDVRTGVNPAMPAAKLQTFQVRGAADDHQIDVP